MRSDHRSLTTLAAATALALAATLAAAIAPAGADPAPVAAPGKVSMVRVDVTDAAAARRLAATDLDVMTFRTGAAEILLYGPADERRLRAEGFAPELLVADVEGENRKARAAEEARAKRLEADPDERSPLPTGRVSYRTLAETNDEIRQLARRYPFQVKRFKLPHKSLLGTDIWGMEISNNVHLSGHKPVYLLTGMHHSREWPTVELTMEFAWDLLQKDYRDPRITSLLNRPRPATSSMHGFWGG